jgi:hypothetical protein
VLPFYVEGKGATLDHQKEDAAPRMIESVDEVACTRTRT